MQQEEIKVSIICNAYNQEDYITETIESFVSQKTNFKYEILIHDDASTDRTAEIIRNYEKQYPEIIKPIYQEKNQYSQGVSIGNTFQFPRALGKYIALCEGDDYWTDPLKLQKQYDALETHPEIDMCAHGVDMVYADTKELVRTIEPSKKNRVLSAEEVIFGEGGYLGTNSLFFRKSLLDNEPPFRQIFRYDYTLQIMGALRNGIYYIAEIMSSYRWLAKGSWTERVYNNQEKHALFLAKKSAMFDQLDLDTNGAYSEIIEARRLFPEFQEKEGNRQFKELLSKKYKCVLKALPFKRRLAIKVKARCVFVWHLKNWIRGRKR